MTVEFFISPCGSDTHPGTKAQPFATLAKARDVLRSTDLNENVTIHVGAGNYFLDHKLIFDERDSMGGYTVSYKGDPDNRPVIYGGRQVTGWERWQGNIYRAKSPVDVPCYRLFDNGKSQSLARYPKFGDGYGQGLETVDNETVTIPEALTDYDFSNAQLFGWVGANWFSEMRVVLSVDRRLKQLKVSPGSHFPGGLNERVYIQGVPELLTEPGEWCLNSKDGYIYYWPTNDTDLSGSLIVVASTEKVFEVKGSSMANSVNGLSFENLDFIGSDFTAEWQLWDHNTQLNAEMPEHLQVGLIHVENASDISIRKCRVSGAGHSGIYFNKYAQNCTVEGCWIEDCGFTGVYMNGYGSGKGPFNSADESYVNKGHLITNNFIYDCGKFIGGGCGIQFYQSGDNRITHNLIARMPRYGISYKGNRFGVLPKSNYGEELTFENHWNVLHSRNNVIAYNDIFNVCQDSFDFGGIEAWGPGRDNVWEYNAVHDIAQSVAWDGWAHGLFTDDACHYHTLRGNLIYGLHGGSMTGAFMVKSINQLVENNIVSHCPIGRIFTMDPYLEPATDMVVKNNIINGLKHTLHAYGEKSFEQRHTVEDPTGSMDQYLKGRPVYKEVDQQITWPAPDDLDILHSFGWETNLITANPNFITNPPFWKLSKEDFALQPDSPALKAGFKAIAISSIGLLHSFPFDREQLMLIPATEKMQGELASRFENMRPKGGTNIRAMGKDSWVCFKNVDFGKGDLSKCLIKLSDIGATSSATPGQIGTWDIAGPYPLDRAKNAAIDSSTRWVHVNEDYVNRGGEEMPEGIIDLAIALDEKEIGNSLVYMKTDLVVDVAKTIKLTLNTADSVQLCLNDSELSSDNGNTDASIFYTLELKKGTNQLLLKLKHTMGSCQVSSLLTHPKTKLPSTDVVIGKKLEEVEEETSELLSLHLDSIDGPCIGKVKGLERAIEINDVSGKHDLYLTFNLACNLHYLQFGGKKD